MTAIDRSRFGTVPDDDADDSALLERLRAGEDAAFGELFARHSTAVRRLAFGLVNDRSEAEDLTAEAFFRVLQAIRRGAGPVDNVRGYLLIVARRVAWEWHSRRRDVPVSDEELSNRAGAYPDTAGASTERNLITRAFTSLPERWRSVLWKVEVEGERPAVVAMNFGLSANATAALARRARQGLRAAYLQAHLAADRSSTACRDVLEKLGAYTAGSITGSELRRIRTHLTGCASCTAMHAELRDVCSSLRAHAGVLAVPLAGLTGWQLAASASGFGATVKTYLAGAKLQVALAASSVAALGAVGLVAGSWGTDGAAALDDLDGKRGQELVITGAPPEQSSSQTIVLTTGALSTAAVVPGGPRRSGKPTAPDPTTAAADGRAAQVVFRQTSVEQRTEVHGTVTQVYETTSVTEVNAADQTTTYSTTTEYTKPPAPAGDGGKVETSPMSDQATSTTEPATNTTTTTGPPTSAPTSRASPSPEKTTPLPGKTTKPPQSHQP